MTTNKKCKRGGGRLVTTHTKQNKVKTPKNYKNEEKRCKMGGDHLVTTHTKNRKKETPKNHPAHKNCGAPQALCASMEKIADSLRLLALR